MKKYRLKKDLPTVRAGEVFVRKTDETMQVDMLHRVDSEDVFLPPSIDVVDIINFDEWFEEVKEFEEWKPKESEIYKCLCQAGIVVCIDRAITDRVYDLNISIGNCYPMNTPDELIIKEQKLIPQAMHRLRMAAKKAWFEFNGSEGPDWDDDKQRKYLLSYDHRYKGFSIYWLASLQESILPPFPTRGSAQAYMDNNLDDLKLLFGVEQGDDSDQRN